MNRFKLHQISSKLNPALLVSLQELDRSLPVNRLNIAEVKQITKEDEIRVTWLGHASVLVQLDGINVLTDPVFSERLTPAYVPVGMRRYRSCPCTVDELPNIDAVVISHNHYDHLDYKLVLVNYCCGCCCSFTSEMHCRISCTSLPLILLILLREVLQ